MLESIPRKLPKSVEKIIKNADFQAFDPTISRIAEISILKGVRLLNGWFKLGRREDDPEVRELIGELSEEIKTWRMAREASNVKDQ